MGLATFIGGIHPYEGKELSEDKPIKVLEPLQGEIMVYPLSQHIGAPAKPLVAKGDHVLKGQIIAEAGGFISANVLSSVSGTVKGIESKLVANGAMVQSILVENDGEEEAIEGFGTDRDATKLSKEEIRKIVTLQLNSVKKMLATNGVALDFTNEAVDFIADKGFDPQFGARPVKRVIQKYVLNELSKALLGGTVDRNRPIVIDRKDDGLEFKN